MNLTAQVRPLVVLLGVSFNLTWMHASRNHRPLHADTAPDVFRAMGVRLLTGSALCGVITLVELIRANLSLAGYLLACSTTAPPASGTPSDAVRPRACRAPLEPARQRENLATS